MEEILIETDVVLSLASKSDRHHEDALKLLFKSGRAGLSPYTLIEIGMLVSSQVIKVKLPEFYTNLENLFSYYSIIPVKPRPIHLAISYNLREEYPGLTFFDSLHAATAIAEGMTLVSFDKVYRKIKELNYLSPTAYLQH